MKLLQLMFCLINLQGMHRPSENPAVRLRDSLGDSENLRDSLLECHRTEKGDQSLLQWMNSTGKGAVLGMQLKCCLNLDFWSRQALKEAVMLLS